MKKIIFIFLALFNISLFFGQVSVPKVGIWYATWHANQGNYLWSSVHGAGSSNQLLGDVDGDGKDDAVVYFGSSGDWYVAPSLGSVFSGYSRWISGHGTGSNKQFLADVNGDGKDDAVVYFGNSGSWYVALSNGISFGGYSQWTSGHGTGSSNQLMADVNGDGNADAVVYFSNSGDWYVALSNGGSFGSYSRWISGHGTGSNTQFLGDVSGDGKADAVAFFINTGNWFAANSNGNGFNGYSQWASGHGTGSQNQLLGDIDGDGKMDAIVYFSSNGDWYYKSSNGINGFYNGGAWKYEHGIGSTKQFVGDLNGDNKADPTIFYGNVNQSFFGNGEGLYRPAGSWYSMANPNPVINKPNTLNTWQAWDMFYKPIINGNYQQYDDLDDAVIDTHIQMIAEAGIDFLLFDETNNLEVDNRYILNRCENVIERVKVWNSTHFFKLKYAFAVGGAQFDNNVNTLIYEANFVFNNYYLTDVENYYVSDTGKPLIVSYNNSTNHNNWIGNGSLTDIRNKFDFQLAEDPNRPGLYGWQTAPSGPISDTNIMTIMPGWRNRLNTPNDIARNSGEYYINSWNSVIQTRPKLVIINSFNEHAEKTGIQPSDTSNLLRDNEKWRNSSGIIDDFFYWNYTIQKINEFKGVNSTSLSIPSNTKTEEILFQNPVKETLTFNKEVKSIEIFDLQGKLIQSVVLNNKELNVSKLIPAIYILVIQTNIGKTTAKLIKE